MKLKLVRSLHSGDSESWRNLSVFEVVEGLSPAAASKGGLTREEWDGEVLKAAEDCGIHCRAASRGQRFAFEPVIDWWKDSYYGDPAPVPPPCQLAHLTIEQTGGLDV